MALTSSIKHLVPDDQRKHGQWHFQTGRVSAVRLEDGYITATVRGSRRYSVEVYLDADDLPADGYCTCNDYQENQTPCRHVWATLLAAEKKYPELVALSEDDGPPDLYIPPALARDPALRGRLEAIMRGRRTPAPPRKKKEPTWKRQLATIREVLAREQIFRPETPKKRLDGQFAYLIDPTDSLARADGKLTVRVAFRERKANGELGKPRNRLADQLEIERLSDPADRQAVALLRGGDRSGGYYYYGGYGDAFRMGPTLWPTVLPMVCATGRAFLIQRSDEPPESWQPVTWEAEPWAFHLEATHDPAAKAYRLGGSFRRGGQRMEIHEPRLALAGGLLVAHDRIAPLEVRGGFQWVAALRQLGSIKIPDSQKDAFVEDLLTLPALPRVELPEEIRVPEVKVAPRPCLRVRAPKPSEGYGDKLRGELSFDYDGTGVEAAADGPTESLTRYDAARRRIIVRDLTVEQAAASRLEALGLKSRFEYSAGKSLFHLSPKKLGQIVRTLTPEGWQVEADGKLYRQPGNLSISVTSGIDWFELHGKVQFDEKTVGLPALLAAMKRGENTVTLDDGTLGLLPEEWLKKYALVAATGTPEGDTLKFRRSQAGLLDALLAAQPEATCDELFRRTRDELRRFDGVKPLDPPKSFTGKLRPYQSDALGWFEFLRTFGFGGCLADDMGLGKTVQVLAMLADRARNGPSLVVVPRSLIFNWKQEAVRFAPHLKVLDNSRPQRAKTVGELAGHDIVLTTYGTLRKDVTFLKDAEFDYVILDEAQAVKNADSESAKAVRLLRGHHRLALSGTPIQNHLGDLWSLFEFLNPGMLGSASVFSAIAGQAQRAPDPESRELLSRAVRPFILRRTKEQVARDLPARVEQTLFCELEPAQRKLYDELRDHYRAALLPKVDALGINRSKIMILEALLRLRQAALHPGLISKKHAAEPSAKLDTLIPRLEEAIEEGHKALVFSQFTGMLAIVQKELKRRKLVYEYLDGQTRDRQARVERFQNDPDCKLFLISLKAGGLGLNLTAAEYVFLLDPWWNPAVEAQAIDRAHRIGQTRQVFACRLIAKDTVEEKVLALQNTKRDLADAIINADNSLIKTLGREDLELLLS